MKVDPIKGIIVGPRGEIFDIGDLPFILEEYLEEDYEEDYKDYKEEKRDLELLKLLEKYGF